MIIDIFTPEGATALLVFMFFMICLMILIAVISAIESIINTVKKRQLKKRIDIEIKRSEEYHKKQNLS